MRRPGSLALGALIAAAAPARASPWIVTQYFEVDLSTLDPATVIGDVTFSADIFTETNEISVTQSPIPAAITQATSVESFQDLTIVSVLLPATAGVSIDQFADINNNNYYIPLTYHAPKSCTPGWSHTTSALVYVPAEVTVTPIATLPVQPGDIGIGKNFLIAASEIPSSSLATLSTEYEPFFASQCDSTDTAYGAYPTANSAGNSNDDFSDCVSMELLFGGSPVGGGYECPDGEHWTWGLSLAGLICAWIFSFLGFFLICGLIENFFMFRSLCRGKAARRGLPICWAFMFPFLSCFFLLGANKGFVAKPVDEQQVLQRRWDDLGFGTKLGQWLSWGFRWNYPPFLGPVPAKKGTAPNIQASQGAGYGYPPAGGPFPHAPPQMTHYPPPQQGPPQESVSSTAQPLPGQNSPYSTSPYQQPSSPYGSPPQPQQTSPYGSPQPQAVYPYGSPPPQHMSPYAPPPPQGQPGPYPGYGGPQTSYGK